MNITVNGIELYYEKLGEGRPLILLHGNGEDGTIFDTAVKKLQHYFTCYLIDSRGHGKSETVNEFHYQDMAADVIEFMEKLELERVILYGFSDGGIIGLLAAGQCDRIADLIISGANLTPDGVKSFAKWVMKFMYLLHKDPKVELMLKEPDITEDDLEKIQAHTLVLAGEKDLILESETRRIAEGIKGSQMKIIPKEDHGSYIIHKERIADEIIVFIGDDLI